MEELFGRLKAFEEKILRNVLVIVFLVPVLVALIEVFRRYALGKSYPWQQDIVVYLTLVAVFLHLGPSERLGAHLRMDLFKELLVRRNPRLAGAFLGIGNVVAVIYVAMFVYWGTLLVSFGKQVGRSTPSMIMKVWPFYVVMVAGFVLLWLWLVFRLYHDIQVARGKQELSNELLADPATSRDEFDVSDLL